MADEKDTQNDRFTLIISLFAAAAAAAIAAGLICLVGLTNPILSAAFGALASAVIALIIKESLQKTRNYGATAFLNRSVKSSKEKPGAAPEDELDVPEILDPASTDEEEKSNDAELFTDGAIGAVNATRSDNESEMLQSEPASESEDSRLESDEKSIESTNDNAEKSSSLKRESDQNLAAALNRKRFANRVAIACVASGIATAAVVAIALNQFSATEASMDEPPSPIVEESSSRDSSTASVSNSSSVPEAPSSRALPVEEDNAEPDAIIQWTFEEIEPTEIPDESIPDLIDEQPSVSEPTSSNSTSSSMSDSAFSEASSASSSAMMASSSNSVPSQ